MNRLAIAQRMMSRLQVFPAFNPTKRPTMAEEYTAAIGRMLDEFGCELTYDAITAAIDNAGPFPPTPAELRSWISVVESRPRPHQVIDYCDHNILIGELCPECLKIPCLKCGQPRKSNSAICEECIAA